MPQPPAAWDDPFVPIRPIADTTGRPIATIYRWVHAGVIRSMVGPDGTLLVAMDDYLVATEKRPRRKRQRALAPDEVDPYRMTSAP